MLAQAGPPTRRRRQLILAICCLSLLIVGLDTTIVNVALPAIQRNLHASVSGLQWTIDAYTLVLASLLMLSGSTADRFGRRLIFMSGVSIFAAASIGCGLASDVQVLIAARTVQGIGAALLVPCSLALIGVAFDEKERGAAIGIWSGASAIASGAAPLIGGWLVDHWTWRAIFLINPVLAVVTLWITASKVPESRAAATSHGIDWFGSVLVFAGLGALVYGLTASAARGWSNVVVLASLSAALKYIRSLGDAVKDLQTGGIRYQKNPYSGPDPDSKKTAFSCWTQFTFTLTDFDKYGPIADALSKLDGIQVQSVDYASSKEQVTRREALKQALLNAHDKASDLALTANCYIDKPLEVMEGTPDNGPRPMLMARTLSISNTPDAVPGQLEISASVTATYDLYYK